jgi:hypothetical protein
MSHAGVNGHRTTERIWRLCPEAEANAGSRPDGGPEEGSYPAARVLLVPAAAVGSQPTAAAIRQGEPTARQQCARVVEEVRLSLG